VIHAGAVSSEDRREPDHDAGGWEVPGADGTKARLFVGTVYRTPENALPGAAFPSGLTFDVTGIEGRQGAERWEGSVSHVDTPQVFGGSVELLGS
jgi:hypothetical protein